MYSNTYLPMYFEIQFTFLTNTQKKLTSNFKSVRKKIFDFKFGKKINHRNIEQLTCLFVT